MKLDIREEREKLGMSTAEFAKLLGYHNRTIQKWESGEIKDMKLSTYSHIKGTLMTLELCNEKN